MSNMINVPKPNRKRKFVDGDNDCNQMAKVAKYYLNEELSDVTICVKDAELPAHRFVLATQSPVLSAMLTQPFKESKDNKIRIEDCDEDTMRGLLSFMYKGELEYDVEESKTGDKTYVDSSVMAHLVNLMLMADKYDMKYLVKLCIKRLEAEISMENVGTTLVILQKCCQSFHGIEGIDHLRAACIEFIVPKFHEFRKTNDFNDVFDNTELRSDLLDAYEDYVDQPSSNFSPEKWRASLDAGSRVDALDGYGKWISATVLSCDRDIIGDSLVVSYDGWDDRWNERFPRMSGRLAPLKMFAPQGDRSGADLKELFSAKLLGSCLKAGRRSSSQLI